MVATQALSACQVGTSRQLLLGGTFRRYPKILGRWGGRWVQLATKQMAPAQPLAFQFVASSCYYGIPLCTVGHNLAM
jgi:hypothetical protein